MRVSLAYGAPSTGGKWPVVAHQVTWSLSFLLRQPPHSGRDDAADDSRGICLLADLHASVTFLCRGGRITNTAKPPSRNEVQDERRGHRSLTLEARAEGPRRAGGDRRSHGRQGGLASQES